MTALNSFPNPILRPLSEEVALTDPLKNHTIGEVSGILGANKLGDEIDVVPNNFASPAVWLVSNEFVKSIDQKDPSPSFRAIRSQAGWIRETKLATLAEQIRYALDNDWSLVMVCPPLNEHMDWLLIACEVEHTERDRIVVFNQETHAESWQQALDTPDYAVNKAFGDALDHYESDNDSPYPEAQWHAPIDKKWFSGNDALYDQYQAAFKDFWLNNIDPHREAREYLFALVTAEDNGDDPMQ